MKFFPSFFCCDVNGNSYLSNTWLCAGGWESPDSRHGPGAGRGAGGADHWAGLPGTEGWTCAHGVGGGVLGGQGGREASLPGGADGYADEGSSVALESILPLPSSAVGLGL